MNKIYRYMCGSDEKLWFPTTLVLEEFKKMLSISSNKSKGDVADCANLTTTRSGFSATQYFRARLGRQIALHHNYLVQPALSKAAAPATPSMLCGFCSSVYGRKTWASTRPSWIWILEPYVRRFKSLYWPAWSEARQEPRLISPAAP